MLKQEKRRAAEAEATLKDARVETKRRVPSPILGRTSPIQTISHSLMSMNAPTSGSSSLMASRSGVSNDSSGGHVVSLSRGSQESVRLRAVLKEGTLTSMFVCVFGGVYQPRHREPGAQATVCVFVISRSRELYFTTKYILSPIVSRVISSEARSFRLIP